MGDGGRGAGWGGRELYEAGRGRRDGKARARRREDAITWSEWTHNAEYGLDYRWGATKTEVDLDPPQTTTKPGEMFHISEERQFRVEVRNSGKETRALHAYGSFGGGDPALVCEFYAGDQSVGWCPVVGDAMEGWTELRPGESFVRALTPVWGMKELGRKDVELAIYVVVAEQKKVELRTKPLSILFKRAETSKAGGAAK